MKIKLDDGALMPKRAYQSDAGADLFCRENVVLKAGERHIFDTGVHIGLDDGFFAMVASKSGLACKHGISCIGGIVDAGYSGSIAVCLQNHSKEDYSFAAGDKIAQLIVIPCACVSFEQCEEIVSTGRGANGFGSTGK